MTYVLLLVYPPGRSRSCSPGLQLQGRHAASLEAEKACLEKDLTALVTCDHSVLLSCKLAALFSCLNDSKPHAQRTRKPRRKRTPERNKCKRKLQRERNKRRQPRERNKHRRFWKGEWRDVCTRCSILSVNLLCRSSKQSSTVAVSARDVVPKSGRPQPGPEKWTEALALKRGGQQVCVPLNLFSCV